MVFARTARNPLLPVRLHMERQRSVPNAHPGYRQVDSSLFKDFHIYGEHAIGFRANFYNSSTSPAIARRAMA